MSEKIEKEIGIETEACERLAWNRPTITTFDVMQATEGGQFTNNSPGDDGWYAS